MGAKLHALMGLGVFLLLSFVPAAAEEYKNSRALSNLSAVKVYFDVNIVHPGLLVRRLEFIDKTLAQLVKAGVTPEFIIGFRSTASNYVTKGSEDYVFEDEEIEAKKKVHAWVKRFKKQGIIMEQCMLAAELHEIDPKDFLPEIELVLNGYISMIGYQAKGYSQVNMD